MAETKNKIAKYLFIEQDIQDKINRGIYKVNQALPTEIELSKIYDCSRVTIRQALSNLAFKGYITKTQGSGSYVNKPNSIQSTPFLISFSEDMIKEGKTPTIKVTTFNIKEADTYSNILNIKPEDQIFFVERLHYADNVPIIFERSILPTKLHKDLSFNILEGSKFEYAQQHDLNIDHASQQISTCFAQEDIAKALNISTDKPILLVSNITLLDNGEIFDYSELYINTDLYKVNISKQAYIKD